MRQEPDQETREARRRTWINRFAERQRRLRQWISFPDLTNWCAQSTTTASAAEQAKARHLAFELLAASILKAEFERAGRSKVLFLHSRVMGLGGIPCRLERRAFERQLQYAATMTPESPLPLEVLTRCWLPCGLAQQWLEMQGYRWPLYLYPERPAAALPMETQPSSPPTHAETVILGSARDRAGGEEPVVRRPSRQKPFWPNARNIAFTWFDENGYPLPGDQGQAKLEQHISAWLVERGYTAAESTIRKYVKCWIEEYKVSVSTQEAD